MLRRFGRGALVIVTLGGFGVAATSLAALLVSEQTRLFGWMEPNYRPAVLVALASEAAATICLGLLLVLAVRAGRFVGASKAPANQASCA